MAHRFVHIEIPSSELVKTGRFYSHVFGWIMDYDKEADYLLFETGDGMNGAFYHSPEHTGHQGVVVYINVESIEETLELIQKHGGKAVVQKREVKDLGSFALFGDPDNNVLGIWEDK